MAALTRDILGFKYYRADTEGGNRQKCEQMIQVSVDVMLRDFNRLRISEFTQNF